MLDPEGEVVAYRCGEDLAEKAARYLDDAAARRRIADAGLARVRAQHTYVHRLRRILRDAEQGIGR
jgi:spore maturation protein CgeB